MKLIIAGHGYVGKAYHEILKGSYDIVVHDPKQGYDAVIGGDIHGIICCVSTPELPNGNCDSSNVLDILEIADKLEVPVLIKSTIDLQCWNIIKEEYSDVDVTFSPEFLRAKTALEDLRNTEHFMLAGGDTNRWASVLIEALGKITIGVDCSPEELIMIKYFRNSFLANKVAFFNQMHDLCEAAGINYDAVAVGVGADRRIGTSHTQVTKQRGYGGHCFPKDINAIINTAKKYQVNLSILEETQSYNKDIRNED